MSSLQRRFPHLAVGSVVLGLVVALSVHAVTVISINGTVSKPDGTPASGLNIEVQNVTAQTRLGKSVTQSTKTTANGGYSVAFLELFADVALAGDEVRVTATDAGVIVGLATRVLTAQDINAFASTVNVTLSGVVVRVAPASVLGDGVGTAKVSVSVTDKTGAAVTDDTLSATATAGSVGAFANLGGGNYEATFTAPVSGPSTQATLTVTSAKLQASGVGTVTIVGVPSTITVTFAQSSLVADGKATTTVTASIARNAVPVKDENVTFSVPAGMGAVGEVTNKGDGTYTAAYTAGTKAGVAAVTATAGKSGDKGAANLTLLAGPPARISSVVAAPAALPGNGAATATITATILDAFDNPVSALTNVAATATAGGGVLSAATDAGNGQYRFVYTTPKVAADTTVTVQVTSDTLTGTATLTLTPEPEVETITLTVEGKVFMLGGEVAAPDNLSVSVVNVTRNVSQSSATGATGSGTGRYGVTFIEFLGGIAAKSGDQVRVTVTDAAGKERGRTEKFLTAADVRAAVATVNVTTDIVPTTNVLTVSGTVTYSDGVSAVSDREALLARVTLKGTSETRAVGDAGPGKFSVPFLILEGEPIAAGDAVTVNVLKGENVLATGKFTATAAAVIAGALDVGAVQTTLARATDALAVSGAVSRSDGTAVPSGATVRVTNLSDKTVAAQSAAVGGAGADRYSVFFFALGEPIAHIGDVLSIEVFDAEGTLIGVKDVTLTGAEVLGGALTADVVLAGVLRVAVETTGLSLDANGIATTTFTVTVPPEVSEAPTFSPTELFTAPVAQGGGVYTATFNTSYARDRRLGAIEVTVGAGNLPTRRVLLTVADTVAPTVAISPEKPAVVQGNPITLTAVAKDNAGIASYAWDFNGDGVADATTATATYLYAGKGPFTAKVTVTDVADNTASATAQVTTTTVTIGGLALDLPNYIRILQKTLSTAIDAPGIDPEVRDLIKTLLPQLIRDGSLTGIAVPIFPASLAEQPTKPVLVPDAAGLDLENFGNALFLPLLDAAAENPMGILDDTFRVPLALVGSKFTLYVRTAGATGVQVKLTSRTGADITVDAQDVSATGAFDYPFVMDEELLLLMLPAWPGSNTKPIESVTLYLSDSGQAGPYRNVPMALATVNVSGQQKRVWRATESLTAGRSHHYYYRIRLANPVPVSNVPGQYTQEWAVPDIRNLQFEDRGFPNSPDPDLRGPILDTVARRIQPILASLINDVQREAIRLAESAILNDPNLQAQIANDPEIRAVLERRLLSDTALQQRIIGDPRVRPVIEADPAVRSLLEQIIAQVAKELETNAEVLAAAQAVIEAAVAAAEPQAKAAGEKAAQDALLAGKSQAEAEQAGKDAATAVLTAAGEAARPQAEAAARAKGEQLAEPIVRQRFEAQLPTLLPTLAPKILPIIGPELLPLVQADIQPILIAKFGPQFLNQALANVVGDPTALLGRIQADLTPFAEKVGAEILRSLDVPIVSKFTVPSKDGLWIASVNMEQVPDGDYTVSVNIAGGASVFANGKPIRIDRTPGDVTDLMIAPNKGAAGYTRESDGVQVVTAVAPEGTLNLSASLTGDGLGALFQLLGVEDDPAKQSQRVWIPVNATAVLLATGLKQSMDGVPDDLYDAALLAVVVSDPDLIAKLQQFDPDGVGSFLKGWNALSPDKQAQVRLAASIVRAAALSGDLSAVSSALSLNFAALQDYALLLANLRTIPGFSGGQGATTMLLPPNGRYWVRAVSVDQFGNLTTQLTPTRLDVVAPDADTFRITKLSIGDQNGDGDTEDPFESIAVGEDGVVDAAKFRIWANVKSVDVTIANTVRTAHPLTKVALQVSTDDGKTWEDAASVAATALAGIKQGDTLTLAYAVGNLGAAKSVRLRVAAKNALTVVGESVASDVTVDPNPLAVKPAVITFAVEQAPGTSPSPDSGGARATLNVRVTTPAFTLPDTQAVRLELDKKPLNEASGGPKDGLIRAATAKDGTLVWEATWDTSKVADTVTNKAPEARDASKDDNPYVLRAVPVDVDGKDGEPSEEVKVSVDNVDDVPPATGTKIALVEREARKRGTFEPATKNAAGQWVLRARARFTVDVAADPATFAGGQIVLAPVDAGGNVGAPVGAVAAAAGETSYEIEINTRDFPNGVYGVAALAADAAKNVEVLDPTQVQTVSLENIEVAGVRPDDRAVLAKIVITQSGVLKTNRNLGQAAAVRPVGGVVVIQVSAPFARLASLFFSADAAALSDAVLAEVDLAGPDVGEGLVVVAGARAVGSDTFVFTVDTRRLPSGVVKVRAVLGASPNVLTPVADLVVDNTAPALQIRAPLSGTTVGLRPVVWAEYSDESQIATLDFALRDLAADLVKEQAGTADAPLGTEARKSGANIAPTRLLYSPADPPRLQPGAHTAAVQVVDLAGNAASGLTAFVVSADTQPPQITAYSPSGNQGTVRPKVVVVSFAADVAGVAKSGVSIRVDGAAVAVTLRKADGTDAKDGESVRAGYALGTIPADLKAGDHEAVASLTDGDGNTTSVAWRFAYADEPPPPPTPKDTERPTITAVSPTGTIDRDAATLVVSFNDASRVTSATFSLDGAAAQAGTIVDNTRARRSVSGLAQGAHTVVATVTDEAGNAATAEWTFAVEIDIVPPTITAQGPTGYVGALKPTIAASFSDNKVGVDDASITLKLDGKSVTPASKSATSVSYTPTSELTPGTHQVSLEVADALANKASATWEFIIETTPPSITSVAPVPGVKWRGDAKTRGEIVVAAFYADAQSGVKADSATLAVTLEGKAVDGAVSARTTSGVSWRPKGPLAAGVYTASVSVADNVGNTAKHEWSFVVEEEVALRAPRIVPNPFAEEAALWFVLGREADVTVNVYDFGQRLVGQVPLQHLMPGTQKVSLSVQMADFARGVYFCQILVDSGTEARVVKVLKMAKAR